MEGLTAADADAEVDAIDELLAQAERRRGAEARRGDLAKPRGREAEAEAAAEANPGLVKGVATPAEVEADILEAHLAREVDATTLGEPLRDRQ